MHVNCTNNTYMVQCCCMAWRKEPFEEHLDLSMQKVYQSVISYKAFGF